MATQRAWLAPAGDLRTPREVDPRYCPLASLCGLDVCARIRLITSASGLAKDELRYLWSLTVAASR